MNSRSIILGFAIVSLLALLLLFTLTQPGNSLITGNLIFEPDRPIQEANSTYSMTPTISLRLDYSMKEIERIIEMAKSLVRSCNGADAVQIESCVASELQNTGWQVVGKDETGFIYKFDVKSKYTLPIFNETEKKLEEKEIVYKFALDFSS
jgi:hypothetical protein